MRHTKICTLRDGLSIAKGNPKLEIRTLKTAVPSRAEALFYLTHLALYINDHEAGRLQDGYSKRIFSHLVERLFKHKPETKWVGSDWHGKDREEKFNAACEALYELLKKTPGEYKEDSIIEGLIIDIQSAFQKSKVPLETTVTVLEKLREKQAQIRASRSGAFSPAAAGASAERGTSVLEITPVPVDIIGTPVASDVVAPLAAPAPAAKPVRVPSVLNTDLLLITLFSFSLPTEKASFLNKIVQGLSSPLAISILQKCFAGIRAIAEGKKVIRVCVGDETEERPPTVLEIESTQTSLNEKLSALGAPTESVVLPEITGPIDVSADTDSDSEGQGVSERKGDEPAPAPPTLSIAEQFSGWDPDDSETAAALRLQLHLMARRYHEETISEFKNIFTASVVDVRKMDFLFRLMNEPLLGTDTRERVSFERLAFEHPESVLHFFKTYASTQTDFPYKNATIARILQFCFLKVDVHGHKITGLSDEAPRLLRDILTSRISDAFLAVVSIGLEDRALKVLHDELKDQQRTLATGEVHVPNPGFALLPSSGRLSRSQSTVEPPRERSFSEKVGDIKRRASDAAAKTADQLAQLIAGKPEVKSVIRENPIQEVSALQTLARSQSANLSGDTPPHEPVARSLSTSDVPAAAGAPVVIPNPFVVAVREESLGVTRATPPPPSRTPSPFIRSSPGPSPLRRQAMVVETEVPVSPEEATRRSVDAEIQTVLHDIGDANSDGVSFVLRTLREDDSETLINLETRLHNAQSKIEKCETDLKGIAENKDSELFKKVLGTKKICEKSFALLNLKKQPLSAPKRKDSARSITLQQIQEALAHGDGASGAKAAPDESGCVLPPTLQRVKDDKGGGSARSVLSAQRSSGSLNTPGPFEHADSNVAVDDELGEHQEPITVTEEEVRENFALWDELEDEAIKETCFGIKKYAYFEFLMRPAHRGPGGFLTTFINNTINRFSADENFLSSTLAELIASGIQREHNYAGASIALETIWNSKLSASRKLSILTVLQGMNLFKRATDVNIPLPEVQRFITTLKNKREVLEKEVAVENFIKEIEKITSDPSPFNEADFSRRVLPLLGSLQMIIAVEDPYFDLKILNAVFDLLKKIPKTWEPPRSKVPYEHAREGGAGVDARRRGSSAIHRAPVAERAEAYNAAIAAQQEGLDCYQVAIEKLRTIYRDRIRQHDVSEKNKSELRIHFQNMSTVLPEKIRAYLFELFDIPLPPVVVPAGAAALEAASPPRAGGGGAGTTPPRRGIPPMDPVDDAQEEKIAVEDVKVRNASILRDTVILSFGKNATTKKLPLEEKITHFLDALAGGNFNGLEPTQQEQLFRDILTDFETTEFRSFFINGFLKSAEEKAELSVAEFNTIKKRINERAIIHRAPKPSAHRRDNAMVALAASAPPSVVSVTGISPITGGSAGAASETASPAGETPAHAKSSLPRPRSGGAGLFQKPVITPKDALIEMIRLECRHSFDEKTEKKLIQLAKIYYKKEDDADDVAVVRLLVEGLRNRGEIRTSLTTSYHGESPLIWLREKTGRCDVIAASLEKKYLNVMLGTVRRPATKK